MRSCGGGGWCGISTRTGRCRTRSGSGFSENGLRAPSGGFSQGWAFLTLEGDERERYWRIAAEDPDLKYVEWVTGLRRAPLLILRLRAQGRVPRSVHRGGQGLDRSRRGSLDRAVLVRRHRDGGPADVADGRRRRLGSLLFRASCRQGGPVAQGVRRTGGVRSDRGPLGRLPGPGQALTVAEKRAPDVPPKWCIGGSGAITRREGPVTPFYDSPTRGLALPRLLRYVP